MPFKCTFVALALKNTTYRKQIFSRVWAILLLAIFVSAMLIESLHQHDDVYSECKSYAEQAQTQHQLDVVTLKCKLCEVLKSQSHFYDIPSPITFVIYADESEETTYVYLGKHPDSYILSAANKGPPSLMA